MKSILEPKNAKKCYECDKYGNLEEHHIFFGDPNRSHSEKHGLKVHLCFYCHRAGKTGVHGGNRSLDLKLKRIAQTKFEETHDRAEFMYIFKRNYLDEEEECMNKVILMGRLARDPDVRYTQGERSMAIAKYTIAVNRRQQDKEATADFINIVAFDRNGEFAEKYFRKGMRVLVSGRIQTGSYTNKEGRHVYTTEVVVEDQEFADSKGQTAAEPIGNGFMHIEEGVEGGLPFD